MIKIADGFYISEEALQRSRESYYRPKVKSLWPEFQRELRKHKGKLHLNDILRMYEEYQKQHS